MTDSERNGVYRILNEISSFTNRINNRMEYVVFPKEQQKMEAKIQQALEDMNFLRIQRLKIMNAEFICIVFLGILYVYQSYRNWKLEKLVLSNYAPFGIFNTW